MAVRLPKHDHHWKKVASFIEETPDPDYSHVSEEVREAFRDLKYLVRIHWGLYSILELRGESWPFLRMSPEEKQRYQELYRSFNPAHFSADRWMELFHANGIKGLAFTAKHHDGFSLFDTKTRVKRRVNWTAPGGPQIEECDLAYSVMESPYGRDVVTEICDAARRWGLKIDLYFSHPDWYDATFRPYNYHPLTTPDARELFAPGEYEEVTRRPNEIRIEAPPVTEEETRMMLERHRAQLVELLTRYGKIDMLCLDQWMGWKVWPHMRETIKLLRKLQPDCMFRARGIGNYGDYYTPEGFVPGSKENTDMPWMVISSLASSMSYDPDPENYKPGRWIVQNLVDTVSKGGNFMVGIGPDGSGRFHPRAEQSLREAGEWLRANGEGVYGTRPRPGDLWREGDDVRFTQTKDTKYIYAFFMRSPGAHLRLRTVRPKAGTPVVALGAGHPLNWTVDEEGLEVEIPDGLRPEMERMVSQGAFALKIEVA